jgi:hypothetical protein
MRDLRLVCVTVVAWHPSHQRVPGFILAAIKLRSCFCQDWQDCARHKIGCLRLTCLSDPATRVLDLEPELSELNNKDPSRFPSLYNPVLAQFCGERGRAFPIPVIIK